MDLSNRADLRGQSKDQTLESPPFTRSPTSRLIPDVHRDVSVFIGPGTLPPDAWALVFNLNLTSFRVKSLETWSPKLLSFVIYSLGSKVALPGSPID